MPPVSGGKPVLAPVAGGRRQVRAGPLPPVSRQESRSRGAGVLRRAPSSSRSGDRPGSAPPTPDVEGTADVLGPSRSDHSHGSPIEGAVTDATGGTPDPARTSRSRHAPPRPARLWALALGGGVLAGLIAWLVGEAAYKYFLPPLRQVTMMGVTIEVPTFADQVRADRKNATLAFGALGATLGLCLGAAGGLARRSWPAAARGALAGVVLGGAAGAIASTAILPIYFQRLEHDQEELSRDLLFPILIHGGIWATIGAAGGAAFGIGLGGNRRVAVAALGGLIGGALGTVVYDIAGTMVFPAARTTEPLAISWGARLLAMLSISVLTAAMAAMAVGSPQRKRGPAPGAH
jgi:hypothetical protein